MLPLLPKRVMNWPWPFGNHTFLCRRLCRTKIFQHLALSEFLIWILAWNSQPTSFMHIHIIVHPPHQKQTEKNNANTCGDSAYHSYCLWPGASLKWKIEAAFPSLPTCWTVKFLKREYRFVSFQGISLFAILALCTNFGMKLTEYIWKIIEVSGGKVIKTRY